MNKKGWNENQGKKAKDIFCVFYLLNMFRLNYFFCLKTINKFHLRLNKYKSV